MTNLVASARQRTPAAVVTAGAALTGLLVVHPAGLRLAMASAVGTLLVAIAVRAPRQTAYLLAAWLVALGTLRRLTTGLNDGSVAVDPLLAVAPFLFGVLGVLALRAGAARQRSPLTTTVIGLIGVLMLSALNPAQGGLQVGLTGVAVVVAPMLSFFVGRSLLTRQGIGRLLGVVAALAVPAAGYGLVQVFVGFPSWDQRWIDNQGYVALNLGNDVVRPFGSFASGQEFGTFVAVGLVILLAFSSGVRRAVTIPAACLLSAAVWYESARTLLVTLVVAVGVMGAARAGWPIRRALLAGMAVLALLPSVAASLAPERFSNDASGTVAARNVEGLADPFGESSTLTAHFDAMTSGIRSAFTNPLGQGVGSITNAAATLGGAALGTESDPGNAGVAAGLVGLGLYLATVALGFARTYRLASRTRGPLDLAALGIITVTFLHWLTGGLYAVAWLPWFVLGWVDRHVPADAPASKGRTEEVCVG